MVQRVAAAGAIRQVMSPEEFRQAAYRHADWIAGYMQQVRDYPVLPAVQPGDLAAVLPDG